MRRNAGMESVKELLGHASITTAIDTYGLPDRGRRAGDGGGCGLTHRQGGAVVSASALRSAPSRLLKTLVAQLRAQVYVADPDDPVLGRRPCTVAGCDR